MSLLISSDPSWIKLHVRLTTVTFKYLSDQIRIRCSHFCFKNNCFYFFFFSKVSCALNASATKEKVSELNTFHVKKTTLPLTLWIRLRF